MNSKKEYTFKCKKCGKEYHIYLNEYELKNGRYAKHCSRQCANSRSISEETKNKISSSIKKKIENGEKVGCINNLKQKNIQLKIQICKTCGKQYYPSKTTLYSYKYCSEECKQKYHNELLPIKLSRLGGYRKGSGHGKSGWYKGIHCDSSWELAFVIYHLENGLKIKRCNEIRKYYYNNKEYKYFPDFITDDGLIEIKGYSNEQWEAKQQQNPDVKTLYKSDIQLYLDYVIKKYGTNFVELYDDSNPKNIIDDKVNIWVHRYDDIEKIYYTKVINPKDYEKHMIEGWIKGRGKFYEGYKKEHIKTNNIFKR